MSARAVALLQLAGGLALFLYGMKLGASALAAGAGRWLPRLLERSTAHPPRAALFGFLLTALTQSSSATSALLVSLAGTSMLGVAQAFPVLLGAGVGSTLTVQLIAFRFSDWALAIVAVGGITAFAARAPGWKKAGETILGFGLVFYAMHLMGGAIAPFRAEPALVSAVGWLFGNPWAGLAAGALFTVVVQSTGASLALVIALVQQGVAGYGGEQLLAAVVPLILGANLGTVATAFMAAAGGPRPGRRVAVSFLLQKLAGVLVCMPFVAGLAALVHALSAGDAGRQIANAHTLFNLLLAAALLPFAAPLLRLVHRLVPVREEERPFGPRYLDPALLDTPALALAHARLEILRLGRLALAQLERVPALFDRARPGLPALTTAEDAKLDTLQKATALYLNALLARRPPRAVADEAERLFYLNADLETTADIVVKNIVPLADKYRAKSESFSAKGARELTGLQAEVAHRLARLVDAVERRAPRELAALADGGVHERVERLRKSHLRRLVRGARETEATSAVHFDLLDYLRKIDHNVSAMAAYLRETNGGGR